MIMTDSAIGSNPSENSSPVDFLRWPAQLPEASSTPLNSGVLRAWHTSSVSGGLFRFGVAPLLMSAGSSLPLGASASNFDPATGTPGKQTYPGEEEDDKIGAGRRRQTYPGEESEDKDGNKDFYSNKANKSWFGSFISKFARKSENEMKLPDDKHPTIVWDAERKRWINTDQTEEEMDKPAAPPPKDSELSGGPPEGLANSTPPGVRPPDAAGSSPPGAGPPLGPNKFSLKQNRGPRKQYVDVLAAGNTSKPCVAAPTHLFNTLPKSASMPANMFVPSETTDMGLFLPVTADSISKDGEGQGSSDVQTLANQQTAAQQSHLQPITTHDPNETYGELGIKANQGGQQEATLMPPEAQTNLSRRSSVSSVSQEVQHYMQPSADTSQPPPPSTMPMMFNPAQFSHAADQHAAPAPAGPPAHGPRYGQRRLYPK
ncbi:hypothetical protein NP493_711g02035 [Ridgeia piscesae]|uniref:Uncharacterized protein n=1 Tax=Ridgeia piscesae TaxID=27915 RepID=A0AAD9KQC8_RIDPI|nr:hypothetical protein NP493_711g02035 [Ridgeia piscesae]